MRLEYGRNSFAGFERGQEQCYLLTNGLGGYSSQTVIGSNARGDHALLMAALQAPNHRYHMVTRVDETLKMGTDSFILGSQQYAGYINNREGFHYLDAFCMEFYPVFTYRVRGIEIRKSVIMPQQENTVGIRYEMENRTEREAFLEVVPLFQFVRKGEICRSGKCFTLKASGNGGCVSDGTLQVNFRTDGEIVEQAQQYIDDLYYEYDARDGRPATGGAYENHLIRFRILPHSSLSGEIIYSTEEIGQQRCEKMMETEAARQKLLEETSGFRDKTARLIARNCSQYVVNRESTGGKSIIAGYPFFEDWGRDTMIALPGLCILTGQLENAKSILTTFIQYRRRGLMPNLFPEGENEPEYNTADAALLFIGSVYEYDRAGGERSFIKNEAWPVIREIIDWYQKGTDYHIKMDSDGLIMAGSGQEQVTWMDVRINGILPTPRHGKPVELNAQWHSALMIAAYFADLFSEDGEEYRRLAEKVRKSFVREFWLEEEGYLKDVVSGTHADRQIRCNQIWAVSQAFPILDREKERRIVDTVYEHLYTPYGLRTLSDTDPEFRPEYGGSVLKRDMAYHQGTVWTFPLGAYYLAYLKVHGDTKEAADKVRKQLAPVRELLREGCVGHLAEIYDGLNPTVSRGCFAQAWSMGEMLRVYRRLEEIEKN